jgi:hypothetical protein
LRGGKGAHAAMHFFFWKKNEYMQPCILWSNGLFFLCCKASDSWHVGPCVCLFCIYSPTCIGAKQSHSEPLVWDTEIWILSPGRPSVVNAFDWPRSLLATHHLHTALANGTCQLFFSPFLLFVWHAHSCYLSSWLCSEQCFAVSEYMMVHL